MDPEPLCESKHARGLDFAGISACPALGTTSPERIMASSCVILKNSYLRVSIPAGPMNTERLSELQSEFLHQFESAERSDTIVVDVQTTHRPESGLVRLLAVWARLAAHTGRRFRINGVSRVIADVQQQLSLPFRPVGSL